MPSNNFEIKVADVEAFMNDERVLYARSYKNDECNISLYISLSGLLADDEPYIVVIVAKEVRFKTLEAAVGYFNANFREASGIQGQ